MIVLLVATGVLWLWSFCVRRRPQAFYDVEEVYPRVLDESRHNARVIVDEIRSVQWIDWPEQYLHPQTRAGNEWKVYGFFGFGKWDERHVAECPRTAEMLRRVPNLRTAIISRLGPHTALVPHHGWASLSNEVLRCHLPLVMPADGARCSVIVNGEARHHRWGKWMVFDDSLEHSATNESLEYDRIVLLLDLNRPEHIARGTSTVADSPELLQFVNNVNRSETAAAAFR